MEFNSDNILVNYIKELLSTFNLPSCKTFDSRKDVLNYFDFDISTLLIIKDFKNHRDCLVSFTKDDNTTSFKFIKYYTANNDILNVTKHLYLYNNTYDSYTHKYLGNYLRFLRDYNDINLMSLYNCFSNEIAIINNHKYISIPVKYKQTYTLGLICPDVFEYLITTDDVEVIFKNLKKYSFKKHKPLEKNNFALLNVPGASSSEEYFNESNLKILLKLPSSNSSSIVLLEGDYTNSPLSYTPTQLNYEMSGKTYSFEKSYNEWIKTNRFVSNISLLKTISSNDGGISPFSNRLIEYLLGNAITPEDHISQDIVRSKTSLYTKYYDLKENDKLKLDEMSDEFPTTLRFKFLETINKNNLQTPNTEDLLGYVDKDIESLLNDERYPLEVK